MTPPAERGPYSEITVRVHYSEVDRMGVAYHGRYVVWLDMARTEHLRRTGISYRELEDGGLLLAVTDLKLRFLRSAGYDALVRVRCWVRECGSRRVTFGYRVEEVERNRLLATAEVSLVAMDRDFRVRRLPAEIQERLPPAPDPPADPAAA
jgi:acyl-CoA thioester hydrolase